MLRGRQIMRAAAVVTAITVVIKVLGFVREAVLAAVFGASREMDAYLVAMIIPSLFGFIGMAIAIVCIPVFSEYIHKEGKLEKYRRLLWSSFHAIIVTLSLTVLIIWPLTPWFVKLMAPGFGDEDLRTTIYLVKILLPALVLMGLTGWAQGVLNANYRFSAPASIGIPYSLIIIFSAYLGYQGWGIQGVAVGTLIAIASQFVIQIPSFLSLRLKYRPHFDVRHPDLRRIIVMVGPVIIGVGAYFANTIVDRIFASGLYEGSIAALNYAQRALGLPIGLLALPLVTILYPALSEQRVQGDTAAYRETVIRGLVVLTLLMMPVTVALLVLHNDIVRFLFQRGAFTESDTVKTGTALLFYGLGATFMVWREYLNRCFYSIEDTSTPTWVGAGMIGLNAVLNVILIVPMGLAGLALATAISVLAASLVQVWKLIERTGSPGWSILVRETTKILVASFLMGGVIWWLALSPKLFIMPTFGGGALGDFVLQGVRLLILILIGGIVYTVSCWFLRVSELIYVLSLARHILSEFTSGRK